jgi:hypothetical protein
MSKPHDPDQLSKSNDSDRGGVASVWPYLKRLAARFPTYTATDLAGQAALATLRRLA